MTSTDNADKVKLDKPEDAAAVDIYKKYKLVREESTQGNESQSAAQSGSKVLVAKKSLNIPICDVKTDEEFGAHLPAVSTPIPYVKFVKRVSEDSEPVSEFRVDQDDQQWLSTVLLAKFPEESSRFTVDHFETVLTILERANETKRDTIVMTVALKVVLEKAGLEAAVVHKLLPDIYRYWYSKRDKLGKPLTRLYWPATLANDTNPHQVFRVRDKERYKLRRQHRKNDLDSFKKMQQLRKEFQQARVMVQLMIEREKMQAASFRVERDIFQQQLKEQEVEPPETGGNTDASLHDQVMQTLPARFEPQFKHMWATPLPLITSAPPAASIPTGGETKSTDDGGEGTEEGLGSIAESSSAMHPFPPIVKRGAGRPPKNPVYQIIDGVQVLVQPEKKTTFKRKKSMDKKGSLYVINAQGEVEICSLPDSGNHAEVALGTARKGVSIAQYMSALSDINYQGYLQPSLLDVTNPVEAIIGPETTNVIHECVEGPRNLCRPQWSNFLSPLSGRDQVYNYCTPAEYLQALEYKYDENMEPMVPVKYRSRCRVGRGGRIVIDRIPVYNDQDASEENGDVSVTHTYHYPVSLRPHTRWMPNQSSAFPSSHPTSTANSLSMRLTAASLHAHNSGGGSAEVQDSVQSADQEAAPPRITPKVLPDLPLSNRKLVLQTFRRNTKVNANNWSSSLPMMCQSIPTLAPPPRVQLSAEKISKLQAILAESDSEDERVIIPKSTEGFDIDRTTNSKTAAAEIAMTKFVMNLGSH